MTSASKQSAAQPAAKQESSASASPKAGGFAVLGQRFGNESLGRILQTKLTVSGPQDVYEQEADRVADQVMRMADPDVRTQSQPISTVQRTEESGGGVPTVDASTESAISSLSGRGNPLPASVRSFMEPRFNADFSSVRVHTDSPAQDLARSVSAQAFTVGNNVVFGAGHYSPDTDSGKRLLAHELTHVVQQVPGRVSRAPLELPRETEALLGLDKNDPVAERPPTLEHWLESGPLYVGGLTYMQVQGSIDEIEQFLARQNSSSFKGVRLEQALTLLRKELQRQEDATRLDKKKQKLKRGQARGKAPRPDRFPRILMEKTSVAYPNPADMRREYNLIMQWLAVPDLLKRDRQILQLEQANLKPQLDADRARQQVKRHAARIQQALTPQAQGEADFLISLARTIQGIGKDPGNEAVSYIYDRGEKVAIGTQQAVDLKKKVADALRHAAHHIESNAGMENERYDLQKKIDHDAPVRAWIAGLLGRSDDPGEEVYDRYFRTLTLLRLVDEDVKKGNYVQAASRLPRMEALGHEIKKLSKGFQDAQIRGAEIAVSALEVTRDVSFAIAGSIAAIVAAPVIAGAIGVGGVGGGILTTAGTGLLVGSGTAVVRSGSAALGSAAAGENLDDIKRVALAEGKRGFREGFISGAGGGLTRGLATALGVGSNVGFQTARRLAADSLSNGMTSMVDALWQGKSIEEASEAALRGMLVGLPGSALGGVNNAAVKYALAPLAVGAANYVSAIQSGASIEDALKAATTAMGTHAAVSGIKHDQVLDAKLKQKGQAIGKSVRRAAGTVKRRVGDVVAATAIGLAEPLPQLPAGSRETPALVAGTEGGGPAPAPTPTPTPVEHVATTTPREAAPVENVREPATEAADIGSRTSQGTSDSGGAPPSIPPPPHTPPVNEAERLFQRLEQGIDPTLAPATLPGHQPAHEQGIFRRGMTTADSAYHAYNEALAGSAGREVGIYYNHETGEFAISIGSEIGVGSPEFGNVHWQALVHIHPDAHTVAQYRWPARQDFNYLQLRRLGTNTRVREFIEFDIPGVGRGRTEYGMDPAHPGNEYYMTVHRPDRPPATQRFESLDHFQVEREQRTIFIEKGSLQYQDLRSQLDRHWQDVVEPRRKYGPDGGGFDGGGSDDSGFRTSSGTSRGGGENADGLSDPKVLGITQTPHDTSPIHDVVPDGGAGFKPKREVLIPHPDNEDVRVVPQEGQPDADGLSHPDRLPVEELPHDRTGVEDVVPDGGTGYRPEQEDIVIPEHGEDVTVVPRPEEGPEFAGRKGGRARSSGPFTISPEDLQALAIAMFKRPVSDFRGKLHFYKTKAAYVAAFRRNWPGFRAPRGIAYRDPRTGHLHFSPQAGLDTVVHETIHKIARDTFPRGRQELGEFLDEGITEAVTRSRVPELRGPPGRYAENLAFVEALQAKLGTTTIENLIVHGDYETFRAAVKRLFNGNEARAEEFLGKLRGIDANKRRDQALLDEAKRLLATADGPSSPAASRDTQTIDPALLEELIRESRGDPFGIDDVLKGGPDQFPPGIKLPDPSAPLNPDDFQGLRGPVPPEFVRPPEPPKPPEPPRSTEPPQKVRLPPPANLRFKLTEADLLIIKSFHVPPRTWNDAVDIWWDSLPDHKKISFIGRDPNSPNSGGTTRGRR